MVEYTRNVAGAGNPAINKTAFAKPESVGKQMFQSAAKTLAGSALRGGVEAQQKIEAQKVLGSTLSNEQVAGEVEQASQAVGQQDISQMSREEFQKSGMDYAQKVGASARTVAGMAQKGLVSNIYAEAYARKRLSEVASNPFYAVFSNIATDLAGPAGGGSPASMQRLLSESPELAEIQARAEAEREAIQEYQKNISEVSLKTGLPTEAVEKNLRARARHEELQKNASLTVGQQLNVQATTDFYNFQEALVNSIDPETGKVGAASMSNIGQMLNQQKASNITAITSSSLSDAEKKAKIDLIETQFKGMSEMLNASSKTGFQKALVEGREAEIELLISEHAPIWTALSVAADDKTKADLLFMTQADRKQEFQARYGEGLTEALNNSAINFSKLVGGTGSKDSTTPFKPDPLTGEGLANPRMDKTVEEITEEGNAPTFNAKLHQQASKYPVETLRGVNGGPLLKSAQQGSVPAQEVVSTTVNATLRQIRAEMDGYNAIQNANANGVVGGEAVSVIEKPSRGGRRTSKVISMPDYLQEREQELQQLYRTLRSSPWAWPAGTENPEDAFYELLNGSGMVVPGSDNLRPEGAGVQSPGQSATQRGPSGQSAPITQTSMTGGERPDTLAERLPRLQGEEAAVGTPESTINPAGPEATPVSVDPSQTYYGQDAVDVVKSLEGELTPEQEIVVMEEGYKGQDYDDTKGISTSGVGQTGKFKGKTFKETFEVHRAEAAKLIPELDSFPEEVRGNLISAAYRGMLQKSPKAVELINSGKYKEAAEEYLNAKDYRNAVLENNDGDNKQDGVQFRMERVARAIASLAGGRK